MNSFDFADTSWMSHGNCAHRDPAMFFPSDGVGVEIARKACEGCPVKTQCLEYAIAERIDHGVWGGCSERERRRIIRSRATKRAEVPVAVA
jgi:WhiB family redox-sensing transcriptional regulator